MLDNTTTFEPNPYSWNLNASMLYMEHPAGVGYSYCDPAIEADCTFDDLTDAEDNLAMILGWFAKYPEYKGHDFYLSGESYAGIYVPYMMQQIDWYNKNQTVAEDMINLKGIMVGNGVTNWTYDTMPATLSMAYHHALYNDELYDKMQKDKCDYSLIEFNQFPSDDCMGYLDTFDNLTESIDIYNIFKPVYPGALLKKPTNQFSLHTVASKLRVVNGHPVVSKVATQNDYTPWARRKSPLKFGVGPPDYFNDQTVKDALHIPASVQAWGECSNAINYTMFEKGSQFIWEDLKNEYRMLKFSGDIDMCVPTIGSLGWILAMNRTVTEDWRQWQCTEDGTSQVGGWI